MSENAERVRRALRALEGGDIGEIVAQSHPDVEFVNPPYAIEPGTRHGIEGLKTGFENLLDAFEELRFETVRLIDLGDRVVAVGNWTGRGRGSRYRFDPQPFAFMVTLEDGLMTRYEWFVSHEEALTAAGVQEA